MGSALVAELKNAAFTAVAIKPEGNKLTRMSIQSTKFEGGHVFLPNQAPWLAELEAELFAFPNVPHDDQVDSISQALSQTEPPSCIWDDKTLEGWGRFSRDSIFHISDMLSRFVCGFPASSHAEAESAHIALDARDRPTCSSSGVGLKPRSYSIANVIRLDVCVCRKLDSAVSVVKPTQDGP